MPKGTWRVLPPPLAASDIFYDTPITGATDQSYALVAANEGTLIRFEVTRVAQSGPSPGLAVSSAAVGPVTPPPPAPPRLPDDSTGANARPPDDRPHSWLGGRPRKLMDRFLCYPGRSQGGPHPE